tara:strand:- start:4375 stop:4614 length:240 start_codon:yes stop_codon:yes gene_type:complete
MKEVLKFLDITSIFKDKKFGDLKRWSAKRSIGGVIVVYSLQTMGESISWEGIVLCAIGVLPLCLSMFERTESKCKCNKC